MSTSIFVKAISEYHLPTWYLLPLIELSKFSFGEGNFINSYVNPEGTGLAVEVIDLRLSVSFRSHPEYIREETTDKFSYIYFRLPEKWKSHFELFKKGQYSKFSDEAKNLIIIYSGLKWRVTVTNTSTPITDARLMALEKNPVLRETWEEELGLRERGNDRLSEDLELLSVPSNATYKEF